MKVKDLIKKYPNHQLIEKGYPNSFPFHDLPKELQCLHGKEYSKVLLDLEVKGYKVKDKPFTSVDITHCVFGGKKKANIKYDGHIYVYLKGKE